MAPTFDLVLIATCRPDLLEQTLASFSQHAFRHLQFANVIANIDPYFGTPADGDRAAALILDRFAHATILRPETPHFTSAVKRAWQATQSDFVFHLEEDWLALEDIAPARYLGLMADPEVMAVSFFCRNKNAKGLPYQTARRFTRDPKTRKDVVTRVNAFSTSPGVYKGPFLRQAADLMDLRYDPESQFFRRLNPALEAIALPRTCMFLRGQTQRDLVLDIGRDWRADRGIEKLTVEGQAVWSVADPKG